MIPPKKPCVKFSQGVGISDTVLAVAEKTEIFETYEIIKTIINLGGEKPDLKQVKNSLLGQTEIFRNADNIRRVRALVQAHLETLNVDQRFPDFFSLTIGRIEQGGDMGMG